MAILNTPGQQARAERNAAICAAAGNKRDRETIQHIADQFKLTTARVRQILVGYSTGNDYDRKVKNAGAVLVDWPLGPNE
jgi:hypothetical protein